MSHHLTASLPAETTLAWLADGVRHQLLLRVLAVQRHDALGPLSVARMGLALLQRRLAAEAPDLASAARKAAEADQQVAQSVQSIAVLRRWDGPQAERRAATELQAEAVQLLSLAFTMQGHQLQAVAPAEGDAPVADELEAPDALYVLLGLLVHAAGEARSPSQFRLQVLNGGRFRLAAQALAGAADDPSAGLPALPQAVWSRPIDAQALQWLCVDSGWTCRLEDQAWSLQPA